MLIGSTELSKVVDVRFARFKTLYGFESLPMLGRGSGESRLE